MQKDGWIYETVTPISITLKTKEHIYSGKSKFQKIDIYDTEALGKVLMLDEVFMTSDVDEFFYHESISHFALSLIKGPSKIMVIGGGDGGTVREVLKHKSVNEVELVEIDEEVINVSKKYFPQIACELNNPKVKIKIEDAINFVKSATPDSYDSIICDCTDPDPDGIAEGLISKDFYLDVSKALSEKGIYIAQSGSPLVQEKEFKTSLENLRSVFKHVELAISTVPIYPGGLWSFLLASNSPIDKEVKSIPEGKLKLWNPEYQEKAFALPTWLKETYFTLEKAK